jgi:hypothetical protein
MANNLIQVKRTSVSGRAANTTTLPNAGELALNMTDGILYSTNGSVVFEIGANNTNASITGNLTVKSVVANGSLGTSGQVLTSNGTTVYWSTVSGGGGGGSAIANSQSYTGNGSNTVFTLPESILDQDSLIVSVDGLVQVPNTHYTVSNTTLTFTTAPLNNSVIEARTMPAGSITSYVNTYAEANVSAPYTWTNNHTFNANLTIGSTGELILTNGAGIYANSSLGSNGQVLASNGTSSYWSSITKQIRVESTTSITSPLSWNSDNFDQYNATAQSTDLTFNADSGSPVNGQKIMFRIKDNGTARALTWTTGSAKAFRAIGITLPTTTTINKTLYVGAIYNSDDSRWDVIATALEA